MNVYQFKLPDIGEGVSEGEIVKWHVSEGETVHRDQDMVEVMTDKVTVRISSPVEGKVSRILFAEGQIATVGSSLIEIDTGEEQTVQDESKSERPEEAPSVREAPEITEPSSRILASPAVRRIARERGIDLSLVRGTAENGRVTLDDLDSFTPSKHEDKKEAVQKTQETVSVKTESPNLKETPVIAPSPEDKILDPRGLRRLIFDKMTKSKQVMPHFTVVEEADVTRLIGIVKRLSEMDTRVTLTSFFIKAAAVALKEFPYLNATYNEAARNYTLRAEYNIGMAVDTEAGLTVPVIHHADRKSILEIAESVRTLATRARESGLELKDVQGGTFTVTNVGPIGGLLSTPIINYPEVAILGVHRSFQVKSESGERQKTYLSLSCDHRLIDGAMATRFLMKLKAAIENPEYFLVR
ncbi:MAG: dihydrolipoamide acetyltransferase family protein [Thermoplasmataceae archaeon]|jgi:pyruvate dehydrogenase E2 component (dihydrolipoamide acetyltransferase)